MKVLNARPQLKVNEADAAVFTRPALTVFVLLAGVFVAARLWNLASYNLWNDEIFSLTAARKDWSGLFQQLINNVTTPPLFEILLKVWIGIGGESILWLHLFPTATAIATIVPFFLLGRELNLRATELNLALLFMAVNGYLIFYSLELRMYSLLLLFTVCSMWLFARFFNSEVSSKKHLSALFAVNLLLVYTHLFGWLVVGVEFIFLLFWGRRKLLLFAVSTALLVLSFGPWAYVVVRKATSEKGIANLNWIEQPNAQNVVEYFGSLHGSFNFAGQGVMGSLLFGLPILLWAWHVLRRTEVEDERRRATFWWLVLLSFLAVIITFSVSHLGTRPVWHRRYLIIAAVPNMLLVAIAVFRLRPKWVRTVALLLVAGWVTLAGFQDQQFAMRRRWQSVEPIVKKMVQAEPGEGEVVVYVFERKDLVRILRVYLNLADAKRFQVKLVEDVEAITGDHFWVATEVHSSRKGSSLQELLEAEGYHVGEGFEADISAQDKVFLLPVWREQDGPEP